LKKYERKFEESLNIDNLIETIELKESCSNIAATSFESFYNIINMYKELEKEQCEDKKKILRKLKCLLTDFVTIDSLISKNFDYKGIAGSHYRI